MKIRILSLLMLCLGAINSLFSTAFHDAVSNDDIQRIRELIREDEVDINEATEWGCTPLHGAVWKNSPEIVRELLKSPDININSVPNVRMGMNVSPLVLAVSQNKLEVVRALKSSNNLDVDNAVSANQSKRLLNMVVNGECYNNRTPITLSQQIALLSELLTIRGTDVNIRDNQNKISNQNNTPLHDAVYQKSGVANVLLNQVNIDPHPVNNNGNTPLHKVMIPKERNLMEIIFNIIPSDIINDRKEKKKIIDGLIEHGADPYIRNKQDQNVFELAAEVVGQNFADYVKRQYHNLRLRSAITSLFNSSLKSSESDIDRTLKRLDTIS